VQGSPLAGARQGKPKQGGLTTLAAPVGVLVCIPQVRHWSFQKCCRREATGWRLESGSQRARVQPAKSPPSPFLCPFLTLIPCRSPVR